MDSDSLLEFWQLRAPATSMIRRPTLRVLSGKASAMGCERLWSSARLIFTDNRRSLATERMMQLLNLKCNASMLDSETSDMVPQGLIEQLNTDFESMFEDVALALPLEDVEVAAGRPDHEQEDGEHASGEVDDAVDVQDDDTEPLDLFALE